MRGYRGCVKKYRFICSAVCLCFICIPVLSEAFEPDLEKELQQSLIQSRVIVDRAEKKLKDSASLDDEITKLQTLAENIKASHLLLQERFRLRQEAVNQLGGKAEQRQRVMQEGYLKALGEYLNLVESLQQNSSQQNSAQQSALSSQLQTQQILQAIRTLLDTILPKTKRPIHGSLPYRNLNYPARETDASPAIKPAYKGGNKVVSPDDTKDTPEAPLSLEIAILAQSLNWKPIAIYEYVKNEISTEWYWGCMKGAEETLRQKSGNDCDQATLLTALLRASGFPTRYVRGTMEFFEGGQNIVIDKIRNLIGIDDPLKIAEFFQKAGIPYKPVIQGGKITNFHIEHIWVESRIPYGNYRGTMIDDSDPTWLGLAKIEAILKGKWEGMKARLMAGDIEGALGYFVEGSKNRYRQVFAAVGSVNIDSILSSVIELRFNTMYGPVSQYWALRAESGGTFAYPITFFQDANGIWKIMGF